MTACFMVNSPLNHRPFRQSTAFARKDISQLASPRLLSKPLNERERQFQNKEKHAREAKGID
jgi:hypothetical protein